MNAMPSVTGKPDHFAVFGDHRRGKSAFVLPRRALKVLSGVNG